MRALADIQATLGLDYAGIDFAVAPDGSLLLFEANATMAIIPLPARSDLGLSPPSGDRRAGGGQALAARRRSGP